MIELNYSDIVSTLQSLSSYFIALGIIAAVCVIAMIAVMKLPKPVKFLIRCEAGIAIVLLQNDQDLLPLTGSDNINVFGWASTNPVYGGNGSGSLNDACHTVSLPEGLSNAGFQTNTELTDFYTAYRAGRPEVGMWAQEWTLPEPPANTYSDELIINAKAFSDTALIAFSRPGGEHIDLPKDLSEMDEEAYKQNSPDYVDFPAGHHYLELSQSERDLVDLVCANFDNVAVIYNRATPSKWISWTAAARSNPSCGATAPAMWASTPWAAS